MAKIRRHTIIGNSAAALSAIRAIRRCGDAGPITLISAENCNAYSPVLTTYYIGGRIERRHLFQTGSRFYQKYRVRTLFGQCVAAVEPDRRRLVLASGRRLEYDNLLIASGAAARPLANVEPAAAAYVSTLRTLEDAEKIKRLSRQARRVVVVGAGLVSLQTIRAILDRRLNITLVVGSEQVLSQQMDRQSAQFIQAKLLHQGVEILFGRGVERVYLQNDRAQVRTTYGETLPADLVVVGKGVRPNSAMVAGTAIETRTGIWVDDRMRTNIEQVYAAGDVAEGRDELTGDREVIATWFNAGAQGEIAGFNMAGRPKRRRGQFRENVTTLLGLAVVSLGHSRPDRGGRLREIQYIDTARGELRKLYLDGARIAGALLIGRTQDAGVIRHCIANRIDVSEWIQQLARAPLNFGRLLCRQGLPI